MNPFRDVQAPTTRKLLLGAGHLAALWALAFAQPLFDLLGRTPDFFVARDNSTGDIVILGLAFIFLPPLVMLAIEWVAAKIGPKPWLAVHLFLFTVLAAFLFIQLLDPLMPSAWLPVVVIALVAGALLAIASVQVNFVRNLFDILIIAPVVIAVVFFFFSNTTRLLFPNDSPTSLKASVKREVPVVIISFDELGTVNLLDAEGRIDAERFPNFARMGRESTWYPNLSTTSYFTPTAMPGILTGNRPGDGALPIAADHPKNIFSLLSDSYDFKTLEWITKICDPELCPEPKSAQVAQRTRLKSLVADLRYVVGRLVLPTRFAEELPDVGTNFEDFDEGGTDSETRKDELISLLGKGKSAADDFGPFIRNIPSGNRNLTLMHLKQPHKPWKFGVRGERYDSAPINQLSLGTGKWLVDEPGIASVQQRMLVQTGYADTILGEVLDRLEETGVWDRGMVVVTADHGISFEGNGIPQRKAGEESMGENANPPLLIKYPGETTGRIDRRHVSTLDIVPTIARELRVDGMYETDGLPLQGRLPEREILIKDVKLNEYTVSLETMIAQRDLALARQVERLGNGPLYTLGPSPELIGRRAGGGRPEGGVELERVADWEDYGPDSDPVPMYVTGTLSGVQPGQEIAVGVNGRIRGTTRAFRFEGEVHFGTVIDPDSLRLGRNLIAVYRISDSDLVYLGGTGGVPAVRQAGKPTGKTDGS